MLLYHHYLCCMSHAKYAKDFGFLVENARREARVMAWRRSAEGGHAVRRRPGRGAGSRDPEGSSHFVADYGSSLASALGPAPPSPQCPSDSPQATWQEDHRRSPPQARTACSKCAQRPPDNGVASLSYLSVDAGHAPLPVTRTCPAWYRAPPALPLIRLLRLVRHGESGAPAR